MRIVRNIGHVKRRRRLARLSALVGFLLLASTFALIFLPNLVGAAYVLLLVGFVLFNTGMQQVNKWSNNARHVRADLALDDRLQSLSERYVMLHYIRAGRDVIEHVLVHPGGALVLTARDLPGKVDVTRSKWRRPGLGLTRMFGLSGPQLGNPSHDTTRSLAALDKQLGSAKLEVETAGTIVFTNPMITLDVEDPDFPVLKLEALAEFVRSLEVDPSFTTTERDALIDLLAVGEELERTEPTRTRRPVRVKRRPAPTKAPTP